MDVFALLLSPRKLFSNKIIPVEKKKHGKIHVPRARTALTYFTPQMFTRSKHGHKHWVDAAPCEGRNWGFRVLAEHINYLYSRSWGEHSGIDVRPTDAVYMDQKVRGHASKHVVGAKLRGLESRPPGMREIYDRFIFCRVMQAAYVSVTQMILA